MTRAEPRTGAAARREEQATWLLRFVRRVTVSDFVIIVWAVFGSQLIWFGNARSTEVPSVSRTIFDIAFNYGVVSVVIIVAWMAALAAGGSRDATVVGEGSAEYTRVINATLKLFGVFAIVVYLLKIDIGRGFIITALPAGLAVLLAGRWMWRQWLDVQRRAGRYSVSAVLVGSRETVEHIATRLRMQPEAGYRVVGACIPGGREGDSLLGGGIPILGDPESVVAAMSLVDADTVIVTSSENQGPAELRELSWSLEPGQKQLIVAPALTDVGGPRIRTRPVAGLPLIHVETPRFEGGQRPAKRFFDIVASLGGLLVLSVPLLVVAALVKLTSPGPVLFRQERVGRGGTTFQMLKFRSMVRDAEELRAQLDAREAIQPDSVMFKLRRDPRVTPLGRLLRRYSIDELPQLLNVLRGEMSLVGPRPPLPSEVEKYQIHVHRRFLVKPGLTGLWQVSGRADLSWEDSVRLDLYYVENWSIAADTVILFRTVKAVFGSSGVY